MIRLRLLPLVLLAVAFSGQTNVAHAQQSTALGTPQTLSPKHATIFGELGLGSIGSGRQSPSALTFAISARAMVAKPFALSLDWGFAQVSSGNSSASTAGNPILAGHLLLDAGPGVVDFGLGIGIPVTGDDLESFLAVAGASAIHGLQDPWLYVIHAVPVIFQIRSAFDLKGARLAADGAFAVYFATEGNGDPRTSMQLGIQAGPVFGPVEFGFRAQTLIATSGSFTSTSNDNLQLSVGPYVHAKFGVGFLGAMLLVNVDEPLGFGFDDDGAWGLIMSGGAAF